MKTTIILIAIFLALCSDLSAQLIKVKPSTMSPATVDAFKLKLEVQTQAEADLRYPLVSDSVAGYTAAEVDAKTASGITLSFVPANYATPLDATTYYYGLWNVLGTISAVSQVTIPFNATLVGYSLLTRSTAACSNETGSLYVRVNNSTDILLSNAVTWGVGGAYVVNYFSSGALNTDINAGDKIEMKLITPTWATDATAIYMNTVLFFKLR